MERNITKYVVNIDKFFVIGTIETVVFICQIWKVFQGFDDFLISMAYFKEITVLEFGIFWWERRKKVIRIYYDKSDIVMSLATHRWRICRAESIFF